mgnify:CR=1 FL=1
MNSPNLLYLGDIKKAHGVKGGLFISIINENIKFTNDLRSVWLGETPDHITSWEIENIKISNDKVFLKLRNVDTPEEAKFLKGLKVFIDEIDVPEKTIFETIGFELIEESTSQKIGTIVEVEPGAMQDLLVIQTGKDTKLLPAVPEFLVKIDWDTRQVFVELIEGLL